MKNDPIQNILDELLQNKNIHACMIARHNMITIMPDTDKFNNKIKDQWDILKNTMDDIFIVINKYSQKGLNEIEITLNQYNMFFYILPETENALVTISPKNIDKKQIQNQTNNAREKILKIMQTPEN